MHLILNARNVVSDKCPISHLSPIYLSYYRSIFGAINQHALFELPVYHLAVRMLITENI